jgi:cytochrome bd ubiquinol oxidase subunit I
MDPVLLARIQFALTAAFHFLYPPLSIGLSWFIVLVEYRAWRTGSDLYRSMSRFWIHIFGLVFVVGVATGITMEFQFGTNWAEYSRFVGDIFGAPLAAEGLFAFFLESTFLGVLIWGRERVSNRVYWWSALMVAFGATLSALWIIIANSWQQTPAGYHIVNGRAELTDFLAAAFNPSTLPRYTHTIVASLITGAFFVAGISAWYLLKKRHTEFAQRSLAIAIVVGAIVSLASLGTGHYHAVQVANTQPTKLAAFEALFVTREGAPMSLFGIPDPEQKVLRLEVSIPNLLSLMVHFDPNAKVVGLDAFPQGEWPPIAITFYSYHLMMLIGFYFILLTWIGLFLLVRKRLFESRRFLTLLGISAPLPWIAMETGWVAAEAGRQPWIVYNELRTADGVSSVVPAGQILATIILFTLVYGLLLALLVYLVKGAIDRGPDASLLHYEEVEA